MAVPEAAMHEADGSETTERKIWRSREFPIMEPVSEPSRMQGSSENQFGFRILTADAGHHPRARRLIYDVGHLTKGSVSALCLPLTQDVLGGYIPNTFVSLGEK